MRGALEEQLEQRGQAGINYWYKNSARTSGGSFSPRTVKFQKEARVPEQALPPFESAIRGRYAIEGLLGRSATGATYLVRDQRGGARGAPAPRFVLKEVVEPNKQARRQLLSEGKRLRRAYHLSVARVHRVLKDDRNGRLFLLREYIAGQDLESLRQQQPGRLFSWSSVVSIMAPVVEAVIFLHRQSPPVVHGDIRPANIIVRREDGRAVLVDLGTAKQGEEVQLRDAGRPCYRAPEQYRGDIDARADVYALAATFFTLVTGKLPPAARSAMAGTGTPQGTLNDLALAVPLRKAQAIELAMSADAWLRFSSVEQFWDALWLLEEPPTAGLGLPVVRADPPASVEPAPGPLAAPAPGKPAPQPLPSGPALTGPVEQEDPEPTIPLPRIPKREPVADRVEEREDPDATVRLPPLPPGVHRPGHTTEQE